MALQEQGEGQAKSWPTTATLFYRGSDFKAFPGDRRGVRAPTMPGTNARSPRRLAVSNPQRQRILDVVGGQGGLQARLYRWETLERSEEHTSELQSRPP